MYVIQYSKFDPVINKISITTKEAILDNKTSGRAPNLYQIQNILRSQFTTEKYIASTNDKKSLEAFVPQFGILCFRGRNIHLFIY